MSNNSKHPLAGKKVKLKLSDPKTDPQKIHGKEMVIEDWADRVFKDSWMNMRGNPTALHYALRSGISGLPADDEVVYGKVGMFAYLVHNSEIVNG